MSLTPNISQKKSMRIDAKFLAPVNESLHFLNRPSNPTKTLDPINQKNIQIQRNQLNGPYGGLG